MPNAVSPGSRPIRWAFLSHAVLALVAIGLLLPALRAPAMVHASFWIDIVWIDGFTEELRAGSLYPRWLTRSNGGLGAPVFYFYAPIAFYWAALFKLAGLATYPALLAAAGTAWFASGAAMLAWLRESGRRALPLAALYMALPYHGMDFYWRGAFAEFCAYALLPLLALGVKRAAAARGYALLAIAYALMIATHLPIALLTSVLLIAPWCAWIVWRDPRAVRPIACGLALGLGLAAIYLLPALTLQHHVSFDQLWAPGELRASNWTFFTPARWANPDSVQVFILLTVLLAGTALALARGPNRWALGAIAICAIVAGVVPGLWDLPILAKVQFPWRALMLVEFALVTALARTRIQGPLPFAVFIPLLTLSWLFLHPPPRVAGDWTPQTLAAQRPEVLEYLPNGASRERGTYSPWALALAARHRAPVTARGETILPLFHFPAWQVRCGDAIVPARPDPETRLLRHPGRGCVARRVPLTVERIGAALSLLALALLAAAQLFARASTRPRPSSGRALAPRLAAS